MIKIIDNFLEEDLIHYLEELFIFKTPHYYGHSSFKNGNKFYSALLNNQDTLINFLIEKIKKNFNCKQVVRCYLNIQHTGMDGEWHQDEGLKTIILMISKTLKKNSGQFQLKDNNVIKKINFIQNRLIVFETKKYHRGLSPIEKNTPRVTLAFKTI